MSALKLRNNYLLIYRIYNPPLLLQLNRLVIIIIFITTYDIIVILSPAAVTATHDIVIKINIIVTNRIAET